MYRKCKTQRARERSLHIAQCLLESMEQEHFSRITITGLCRQAGVPRKGFYRYFDAMDDVFNLLIDSLMAQCIDYCSLGLTSTAEVTPERLALCFRFWQDHRRVFDAAKKSDMLSHILTRIIHFHGAYLFPAEPRAALTGQQTQALFSVTGMASVLVQWYESGFRNTPEEMADLTMEILQTPLI